MAAPTSFFDVIARAGSSTPEIGVLFPEGQKEFLVRRPLAAFDAERRRRSNDAPQVASRQERVGMNDVLVRLPSLRESKWRVIVLQRWIGRVERVESDRFVATLADSTAPENPAEEVELDVREVSASDLSLLAPGAMFYWSVGYRDTPGGQRERVTALRFARQPRITQRDLHRIVAEADRTAALLESD